MMSACYSLFAHLLPLEPSDQLHMRRIAKLIDRCCARQPIAAVEQQPGVANECRDVARHRDHQRHLRGGKLARLRVGALAWRIEHHGADALQLLWHEWTAEQ